MFFCSVTNKLPSPLLTTSIGRLLSCSWSVWIFPKPSNRRSLAIAVGAIALWFLGTPETANAACLVNGTTSSNTGTNGNDNIQCDAANDPGGGRVYAARGRDTIVVQGGVTASAVQTIASRFESGNDRITISGSTVTGAVSTGNGRDNITVTDSTVGSIHSGRNRDRVTVIRSTVTGSVIGGSDGSSVFTITDSIIGGRLGGNSRSGTDIFHITNSSIAGNVQMGISSNFDNFSNTVNLNGTSSVGGDVLGGNGNRGFGRPDPIDTFNLNAGTITGNVQGFRGVDRFNLNGTMIGGSVNGGDQNDTIDLRAGSVGGDILGGNHNDRFTWSGGALVGSFLGGSGNDTVTISLTTRDVDTVIDGGTGTDSFRVIGADTNVDAATIRGFERAQSIDSVVVFDTLMLNGVDALGDNNAATDLEVTRGDVTLSNGSVLSNLLGSAGSEILTITGTTAVSNSIQGAGGADTISVLGHASVTGSVSGGSGGHDSSGGSDAGDTITVNTTGTVGSVAGEAGDDILGLLSGTVGSVTGGSGADAVTLAGGTVTGNIDAGTGDDGFIWSSGTMSGFASGDGSDIATVTAAEYDGSQFLDGGDDTDVADGFIDVLTLDGVTGTFNGGNIVNWEVVGVANGADVVIDSLVTSQLTACGGSVTLDGASTANDVDGCIDDNGIEVSGTTVIANDIDGAGGSDTITVSGDASVTGAVLGDGDGQDASAAADAGDIITVDTTGAVGSVNGGLGEDTINLLSGSVGAASGDDGNDTLILDGATVAGVVSGGIGDDTFMWSSGTTTGFDSGDGSDIASVTAAEYDGTQVLDGGDDTDVADGFIDALTLQGVNVTVNSGSVVNWESVTVLDGTVDFGTDFTVGSGSGLGLMAGSGGVISSSGDFSLMGDLETLVGGIYQNRSGAAALIEVMGSIRNAGTINVQDGITGDTLSVSGDYSGTGALQLDVDFSGDTADTLVIAGDVVSGGTTIFVADISTGAASGNDILLVDVQGTTSDGDFQLAGGAVDVGGMVYGLHLVGSQWFLQLELLPANVVYEVYPQNLHALVELGSHHNRVLGRTWLAGGDPLCIGEEQLSTQGAPLCGDAGLWMKFTGSVSDLDPEFSTTEADFGGADIDYDFHSTRVEVGFDTLLGEYNRGKLAGGIWAFYGSASLSGSSTVGNGNVDSDAIGVGASLTWYEDSGFYADAQFQYAEFKSDISASGVPQVSGNKGSGYAASLEIGKTFELSRAFSFTPEIQYLYYDVDFDSFTGAGGEAVYLEDGTTSELRLGGTLEYRLGAGGPVNNRLYAIANVFHKFDATTVVNSAGSPLINKARPWRGEVGFGGSHEWVSAAGARSSIFGEVTVGSEFGSGLSSGRTLGGTLGLKIEF